MRIPLFLSAVLLAAGCSSSGSGTDDAGGVIADVSQDSPETIDLVSVDPGTTRYQGTDSGKPELVFHELPTFDPGNDLDHSAGDTGTLDPGSGDPGPADSDQFPGGACVNTADQGILESIRADLKGTISGCAMQCMIGGASCATDCMKKATGLSNGCSACFGTVIDCTIKECAFKCIDPGSAGCLECQAKTCAPAFLDCAGIEMQ